MVQHALQLDEDSMPIINDKGELLRDETSEKTRQSVMRSILLIHCLLTSIQRGEDASQSPSPRNSTTLIFPLWFLLSICRCCDQSSFFCFHRRSKIPQDCRV